MLWTGAARRSSWAFVILFIAATVAAGYYAAQNLKVNTDTSSMLDPSLDFQQRAADLRNAFPEIKTDVVVIVRAPTLDEADAFAGRLAERLRSNPSMFSGVFAQAQEPFFQENGLLYLSESELEKRLTQLTRASGLIETLIKSPNADTLFSTLADNDALAERAELGQDTLQRIYSELADVADASLNGDRRPFSWIGAVGSDEAQADSHIRLVYATPVLDFSRLQPAKPAIAAIADEIVLLNADFEGRVQTFVTGDPALRAEELQSVTQGIGLSFLLSFIFVGMLLLLAFRSAFLAGLTLVSLIITIVLTAAFAAAVVGELNLVSVAFTVLLVGLGLDFAIHLLLHIQERRADGQSIRKSIRGATYEVGPAMAIAAPTTALAFLSFVPTQFDGIAQLGVIAGAGVVIAFLVSITFLPAALSAFPLPPARPSSGAVRGVFGVIERVSAPVTILTLLLGAAAVYFLPQARFDADPMSLRDPSSPSVQGFNILFEDENTVPYRLTRLVESAEEAMATSMRAEQIEGVRSARSLPDFVPEDQEAKLELIDFAAGTLAFALTADPGSEANDGQSGGLQRLRARLETAYESGPGARLAATLRAIEANADGASAAKLEENLFLFWPQLVDRLTTQLEADYVDFDALPASLAKRYRSENGQWRVDILPEQDVRDRASLKTFVDRVEAAFPDIGGGAIQNQKTGEVISFAMLQATLIALAVIFLLLLLLVHRLSLVILMLAPLALAAVLTTATGVLFDIPFNYANVIVLPLLIGIGVDSGIHLVLRQQLVTGDDETVYGTSTPRAVLFSALTTVASFGSLMLSAHRGTASMGQLLSIAIAFTLVCTLVVLPAAFRMGVGNGRKAS